MSNVRFLRGPQSNLNQLTKFIEGAFYLTNDTDRLYFAQSTDEIVYLNKHIVNVPNINSLPNINNVNPYDFYYAEAENVLCIRLPEATQWTQVNKNTDTYQDTFVDNVTFEASVDENKNIVVAYSFGQKTTDQANAEVANSQKAKAFNGNFVISKELIGQAQVTSSVDVNAIVADNKVAIKTSGVGAAGGENAGFTIVGNDGVTVSAENDEVVISGQTYSIASQASSTDIALKNKSGNEVGKVSIKAGTSNSSIVVAGVNENEITVAHKDYTANIADLTNSDLVQSENPVLNVISGVSVENGHITKIETSGIKLTADKISSVSINENNKLVINVKDADNADKYNVVSTDNFGYNAGNGFVKIGGNLNDHYYTKEDIDNKFKSANALTFKGGVVTKLDSTELNLPINNVSIGDVYIVEENGTYNGINAIVGDLFIAYSDAVENEQGYIPLNNLEWTHVPSGNETIYTYDLGVNADDNAIVLSDNANSSDKIILIDDDVVIATVDGNNKDKKINFSHKQITASTSSKDTELALGNNFTVVTGVTVDNNGHVTGKENTTFTLPGADKLVVSEGKVTLANAKNASLGEVTLEGGEKITGVTSGNIITFNHDKVTDISPAKGTITKSLKDNATFAIIDSVVRDEYGHVTSVTVKDVTLNAVNKFNQDVTVSNASGKYTLTIASDVRDSNNVQVTNSAHTISIQSESLEMSKSGDTVTAEIKWGAF